MNETVPDADNEELINSTKTSTILNSLPESSSASFKESTF